MIRVITNLIRRPVAKSTGAKTIVRVETRPKAIRNPVRRQAITKVWTMTRPVKNVVAIRGFGGAGGGRAIRAGGGAMRAGGGGGAMRYAGSRTIGVRSMGNAYIRTMGGRKSIAIATKKQAQAKAKEQKEKLKRETKRSWLQKNVVQSQTFAVPEFVTSCPLRRWQTSAKGNPRTHYIVQASSTDGTDAWQPFPIGMQHRFVTLDTNLISLQIGAHAQTLLVAFRTDTDTRRRSSPQLNRAQIESNLKANGFHNTSLSGEKYFKTLSNYKFVISPEGNGIDCHRHYESLMAGCIPIIESNPLVMEKYKGCPILYTTDYSEITEEYLEKKYTEMLDTVYDFSRLYLSFYNGQQQADIKRCGNYWIARCQNGLVWYYPTSALPVDLNTTTYREGQSRFCNHFFLNTVAHFIVKKANIRFTYGYSEWFKRLGITFYDAGTKLYPSNNVLSIPDNVSVFLNEYIVNTDCIVKSNLYIPSNCFYQDKEYCEFLNQYITLPAQKDPIVAANMFQTRYQNNNDVFVHVRLGDVPDFTVGYTYYDKVLTSLIGFQQGYITSDTIQHPICQQLIQKHKLTPFLGDEVETIMFASTCKFIVLSAGTFSWFMGLLGFYSDVYYPDYNEQPVKWHPDIYLQKWNKISNYTVPTVKEKNRNKKNTNMKMIK
jgi:hypothetical protein